MPDPHKTPTVPEGWTEVPLGQVADVVFSNVDKKSWFSEPPVSLCNYLDVYQNDYLGEDHRYMEATASHAEIRKFGLRPGDVLITKDSETPDDIGVPAVIDSVVGTLVCGYHLALIRPGANTNPVFLAKQIGHERIQRHFGKEANGSTRYGLSTASVTGLPLWLPPISEQDWVAVVLRSLDDVIRRTEQVIAKLQQMKQGLLHDHLTRGVDEHGDLRPPHAEAPHLYKDSPLGRIPSDWEIKRVEEALALLLDFRGRTPKKLGMEWGGGDIAALSAKNVRVGRVDLQQETYFGSARLYERWMTRGDPALGDVLLTTEAPLGNIAQVPDERRYILSQRVVLLRFDPSVALNDYMALQLAHDRCQLNMKKWSTGTTATGIQMAKMVLIPVVLPTVAEQAAQVVLAKAADDRVASEVSLLAKYRTAKHGLLHDLLTGQVRVLLPAEAST